MVISKGAAPAAPFLQERRPCEKNFFFLAIFRFIINLHRRSVHRHFSVCKPPEHPAAQRYENVSIRSSQAKGKHH